jgi:hypothetical protein
MDEPIYLNHAGTSWPKQVPVVDAVMDAMRSHPQQWPQRFDKAHEAVCRFFGVADPLATACILRRSNSRNPGESWLQDEMTSISDSAGFCASIDDRHEAWRPISNADDSLEPSQQ